MIDYDATIAELEEAIDLYKFKVEVYKEQIELYKKKMETLEECYRKADKYESEH